MLKKLLRLKLNEARERQLAFEEKYGAPFDDFKAAWDAGEIADRYSYEVERDYREWEGAVTDKQRLGEIASLELIADQFGSYSHDSPANPRK